MPEELECEMCRKPTEADVMLLCSKCQAGYHIFCLDPPLQAVPEGNWFCPKHASSNAGGAQVAGGTQVTEAPSEALADFGFTFEQVNAEPQVLDITEDADIAVPGASFFSSCELGQRQGSHQKESQSLFGAGWSVAAQGDSQASALHY